MPRKRFKIYPAPLPSQREEKPVLDPIKAPWSSPRGFATSIPEEVQAWHRAKPQTTSKPLHVKKQKEKKPKEKMKFSCPGIIKKAFLAIYNHFQAITFSEERHDHINDRMHRFLGTVCCIRADVNAAIQARNT